MTTSEEVDLVVIDYKAVVFDNGTADIEGDKLEEHVSVQTKVIQYCIVGKQKAALGS